MIPHGESAPRLLTAGPLSCWLAGADLRQITVDGIEVVQRLYAAVRDRRWGTVPPRVLRQDVSQDAGGFRVTTDVEYRQGKIHHIAQVVHSATAEGRLELTYISAARSAFSSMRVGLCVHHPQELAGTQAFVAHHDGSAQDVLIPLHLSPTQPVSDIRALETEIDGARIRLDFSGTVFEMEDQRTYGDASFKTYCTPLEWPAPQAFVSGDAVEHGVELRVLSRPMAPRTTPSVTRLRIGDDVQPRARVGDPAVRQGSVRHFHELICAVTVGHLPPGDVVRFTINPLVHADDDWSLFENTAAYSAIVARAKQWGKPMHIGPLGLPDTDPRQGTERGAAWLTAALAHLLPALTASDALTLGAPPSAKTPSAALLAALAETTGLLPVSGGQASGIVAFAAPRKNGKRVFISNTSHLPAAVLVSGLRQGGEALRLAPWAMTILDG